MTGPSKQTANPPDTAPEQPLYRGLYRGRFAPSPTGPLHFGSVVAALASYLDARAQQGRWLLRIDDLDAARNVPGAADGFLHDLERLGLHWDETPVLQSRHRPRYHEALDALRTAGLAYPCGCSRKALVAGRYPGTCATGLPSGTQARALRVRTLDQIISFDDLIQGCHAQNIHATLGDFVVLRADGAVAYHLATVIDDAAAGISRVLRGADLLDST
ncbi:MAG: tRNA glutamyl-Q(34) synthetase GluQRS, partial [Gammaproteobacteria bacterium]|nr:tRNA glutamyl-Q(34) synthetase GluQRS [Gammaproteobacteria bacterium]